MGLWIFISTHQRRMDHDADDLDAYDRYSYELEQERLAEPFDPEAPKIAKRPSGRRAKLIYHGDIPRSAPTRYDVNNYVTIKAANARLKPGNSTASRKYAPSIRRKYSSSSPTASRKKLD